MPNQPVSEETRIAAEAYAEIQKQARAMAATLGPAPNTSNVRGEDEIRRWNEMDPQYAGVDANQLVAQGMSPAAATLKKYPFRSAMLLSGTLSPKERVKYAEDLERRSHAYRQKQSERANQAMQDGTLGALSQMPAEPEPLAMPSVPEVPMAAPVPGMEAGNGAY